MKTIVITGADRGLGLALAEQLLAGGHLVFLTCLDPDGAAVQKLAAAFEDRCAVVRLDVRDAPSVQSAAAFVRTRTGKVDRLINNAAVLGDIESSVGDPAFSVEAIAATFDVNTLGPLRVTHAFWDLLVRSDDRMVINVSSEAGSIGQNWRDRWFGYCLSKAALNMESALVHRRLRALGGRAMVVHPGYVRTYMLGTRNEQATYEPEEAARLLLAAIDLRAQRAAGDAPGYFDLHNHDLRW